MAIPKYDSKEVRPFWPKPWKRVKKGFVHSWAIDLGTGRLAGKYLWFFGRPGKFPKQGDGIAIALFKTRKIAREACRKIKSSYPKAKVVRAWIQIFPMDD